MLRLVRYMVLVKIDRGRTSRLMEQSQIVMVMLLE